MLSARLVSRLSQMSNTTDLIRAADGAPPAGAREAARKALLDAAERLLVERGYAGITTRKVAREAGVNHGLVHYYFGSIEELLFQAMERYTEQLLDRQRTLYAAEMPFIEKWRIAMRFVDEDLAAGYPKIWAELHAVAWNRPQFQQRIAQVHLQWREIFGNALARAEELDFSHSPFSPEAFVALVATFNAGLLLERLVGLDQGHDALLEAMDLWVTSLAASGKESA
jgi:AcrR family transcriptional regulator